MQRDPESIAPPPLGTILGDGYELVRFLGSGGMGTVYEAISPDGERLAVKLLLMLPSSSDHGYEMAVRFAREAEVASRIESPHVVPVSNALVDEARAIPFLVMPLMTGLDLASLLERVGELRPTVAVRIVRQLCRALVAAHQIDIVHRDIKPANIFLEHDPEGMVTVRVFDFGIAKWALDEENITRSGRVMGTPVFMAPEQAGNARTVDARADVWSAAATLYDAIGGQPPFADIDNFTEFMLTKASQEVPHLQQLAPWLDPKLAIIIHGALLRKPDLRCPSAQDLLDALEPFAFGSDELHESMLSAIPPQDSAREEPLAELPDQWRIHMPSTSPPALDDEPSTDPLLGSALGDRYTLMRRLGRGGMGTVYEAKTADGQRVAVKVIDKDRVGDDQTARRRFLREARAVTAIANEHVVRVVEADSDTNRDIPFIVMELLQGLDLRSVLARHGPLRPEVVARLFLQACHGIGAAHEEDLVHRDIKPANLFLHEHPSGEITVKVCDFGIAKQMRDTTTTQGDSTELTRTGGIIGSPAYMSPEQAKSAKHVDARTDIWSLGVGLYQALSGVTPWEGRSTVGELIIAICTEEIPPLRRIAPWVPTGLVKIVNKALRRDPAERHGSMAELANELEPFAQSTPLVTVDDLVRVEQSSGASSSLPLESTAPAIPQHKPVGLWLMGGAAAVGTILLIGGYALRAPSTEPSAEPNQPATSSSRPLTTTVVRTRTSRPRSSRFTVRVPVTPSTAKVTVRGRARPLIEGALVLEGEPGEDFEVVATDKGAAHTVTIILRKDKTATPPSISMPKVRPGSPSVQTSQTTRTRSAAPTTTTVPPKTTAAATTPHRPSASAAETW